MSNNNLTDKKFLESLGYEDTYYLTNLCQSIWEFIKNTPVPVFCGLYKDSNDTLKIKMSVGSKFAVYNIDKDVSYFDFIFRFKQFAQKYYPQFEFDEEIEVELETEEMLEKVAKENISLNDAVFLTKKVIKKQKGIILKVFLVKDEFLLEYNGKKEIRTTAYAERIEDILLVKTFIRVVRDLYYKGESGEKIRNYIINSSKVTEELGDEENEVIIDYPKAMLKNFFKIHYESLKEFQLEKQLSGVYKWGKFKIVFQDELIENDCISYYRKRRQSD